MPRSPKITFIVGNPRSGTTWMMWLLANHPRVVACFHAGLFHALAPLHDWWSAELRYGKQIYTSQPKAGEDLSGPDGFSQAVLSRLLDRDQFSQQLAPLVEHVFGTMADCADNPAVVVEKTPENLLFLSWILDLLPDAYVLHIIRDPRSSHLSISKAIRSWRPPGFSGSAVRNARQWLDYIQAGQQVAARTERYKEVRFEDLLQDGVAQLGGIHAWLGLESSPEMCAHAIANCKIEKMRDRRLAPRGFFRTGSATEWRTGLPGRDVKAIEYITSPWLTHFDYPLIYGEQSGVPVLVWIDRQQKRFREIISVKRSQVKKWASRNRSG